jgi:hypothetical protein
VCFAYYSFHFCNHNCTAYVCGVNHQDYCNYELRILSSFCSILIIKQKLISTLYHPTQLIAFLKRVHDTRQMQKLCIIDSPLVCHFFGLHCRLFQNLHCQELGQPRSFAQNYFALQFVELKHQKCVINHQKKKAQERETFHL